MKISALIPARYDSIRFPGKLMEKLGNKTVIQQTYESVLNSKGIFALDKYKTLFFLSVTTFIMLVLFLFYQF